MVLMPEIIVKREKVTSALERIKQGTEDITTLKSNPEFHTSTLNFLDNITSIEDKYYQALNQYKATLLKIGADIQSNIKTYNEDDESLAHQLDTKSANSKIWPSFK